MDMIFLGDKRILKEIEKMNSYFNDRLNEQEERINRISMDTNSNYSMSYMTDKRTLELNDKLYSLNEDLKFIININIITSILLTIFIGINIYLLIH
jgi:hypothetical protein